ncbi:pentatricopeptide repeat-containing protein [Tanacetum coccineum]
MVDLLGRASCLDEAFDFVNSMLFEPHSRVLGALLSASRTHCRLDLAQIVARHISELEPDNATPYVILSDIYLFSKKKDDEELVRTLKRLKGIKKSPGCSLITIKDDCSRGSKPTPPGTSSNPLPEPAPAPMLSADDLLAYEGQLAMSKMAAVHVALMHPQAQLPLKQTMGISGTGAS